jgi:hypothetical protein
MFESDMPDEVRYNRKFINTSMSAGDIDFDDTNIGMNVNLLLYGNFFLSPFEDIRNRNTIFDDFLFQLFCKKKRILPMLLKTLS